MPPPESKEQAATNQQSAEHARARAEAIVAQSNTRSIDCDRSSGEDHGMPEARTLRFAVTRTLLALVAVEGGLGTALGCAPPRTNVGREVPPPTVNEGPQPETPTSDTAGIPEQPQPPTEDGSPGAQPTTEPTSEPTPPPNDKPTVIVNPGPTKPPK
jgi:hypothetical protein